MTTPSGQISLGSVNAEVGAGGQRSLGDGTTRGLAGIPDGQISLSQLRDKSSYVPTEHIEYKYDITPGNAPYYVDNVYTEQGATILAAWDVAISDPANLQVAQIAEGFRFTGIDGGNYIVGPFVREQLLMGTKVYDEYQIGKITIS